MAAAKANRSAVALDTLDANETAYFESGGNEAPEPTALAVAATPEPVVVAPKVEAPAPPPKKEAAPAPVVKAEPTPTAKVEQAPIVAKVEPQPQPEARTVPLPDLIEERKRRQGLEEEVTRANARIAKLAELITPKAPEVQPAQPVEFLADPQGKVKQMDEELATLRAFKQNLEARDQNQAALQAIMVPAQTAEREFSVTHPDYEQASKFLIEHARKELTEMGLNAAQIDGTIAQQGLMVAQLAQQQQRNPAEIIYKRAILRGFKTPEPIPTPAAAAVVAAPAVAPAQAETEDQRIARIQRGQDANLSLSHASGGAQPVIDAQALANMTEAEFTKVYARLENNPAALREFFGG